MDKRVKPALWKPGTPFTLLNGADATARMARMAASVAGDCGVPADDGCGQGVWCEACRKLQPLPKPFDLQNWRTHTMRNAHKQAAALQRSLASAVPAPPDLWSAEWLVMRQREWRARREQRLVLRGA